MSDLAAIAFVVAMLIVAANVLGRFGAYRAEADRAIEFKREFDSLEPDHVRDWASLRKTKQLLDMSLDEVHRRSPRASAESKHMVAQIEAMSDEQRRVYFASMERATMERVDGFNSRNQQAR